MIPEDIFLKIVRSAVKAPSGHNTQPWLFVKEEGGISIRPDFKRALPIADPENRELYISLGCAAETALIAAGFYGYNAVLNSNFLESQCILKIELSKNDTGEQQGLFSFINSRQTTRNFYDDTPISEENLEELKQLVEDSGIVLEFYTGQEKAISFLPYVLEANKMQLSKPGFKTELLQWLRFSKKEAMQKGDGLYSAFTGVPPMGRLLGRIVLKNLVTAKSEEKRLLRQLHKTALIAIFASPNNDCLNWIKTGRYYQRFALTCTKLGLSHSCINLPCQINLVRDKMERELGLAGFPQLLVRLGYSPKTSFSFRRRLNEVILKE